MVEKAGDLAGVGLRLAGSRMPVVPVKATFSVEVEVEVGRPHALIFTVPAPVTAPSTVRFR